MRAGSLPLPRALLCLALLLCLASAARADGPHIAFHGTQGPYTITLFSAPDPLAAGPVSLRLLVQNAGDSTLVPSVRVSGEAHLPSQPRIRFVMGVASSAGDRIPAATVRLPVAGTYSFSLRVQAPQRPPVVFHGSLPVLANHSRRDTILWAVLLPLVLILLFLVNQYAKQRLRVRLAAQPSSSAPSATRHP